MKTSHLLGKCRKFVANPRHYCNRQYLRDRCVPVRDSFFHYVPTGGFALPPSAISFIPTPNCNARCRMCDIGQKCKDSTDVHQLAGPSGRSPLTIEQWKDVIDQVSSFGPRIAFTGGEPYLYSHIIQLFEYLYRKKLSYTNTTNGLLLEKYAEESTLYEMDYLQVSLLGPPHIHDFAAGIEGAFNKVITGIEKLVDAKTRFGRRVPEVQINCPIFQDNYRHLQEFAAAVRDVPGVSKIIFSHQYARTAEMVERHKSQFGADYPTSTSTETAAPQGVDVDHLMDQMRAVHTILKGKCFVFQPSLSPEQVSTWYSQPSAFVAGHEKCNFIFRSALISANGDVVAPGLNCVNRVFGNVAQKRFTNIWNNGAYRRFRRMLKKGSFPICSRCCGVIGYVKESA